MVMSGEVVVRGGCQLTSPGVSPHFLIIVVVGSGAADVGRRVPLGVRPAEDQLTV